MNAPFQHPARVDKATFYRLTRDTPGKAELKDGRIVQQMTKTTKRHNRVVSNFIGTLRTALDLDVWSVTACELSLEIGGDVRMPDVVVERLDAPGPPLVAEQPVLLVEVLSPSTSGIDFTEKTAEYMSLGSVEAYIIASQDEPILWIWQRGAERQFPQKPLEVKGRDGTVEVTSLAIGLPMRELFRTIPDPA